VTPPGHAAERRRPGWQILIVLVAMVGGLGALIWFSVR
jgi:cytoskeletal protein RodZ